MPALCEPERDARRRAWGVDRVWDKREKANRAVDKLPVLNVGFCMDIGPGQGGHGVRSQLGKSESS